MTKRAFQMAEYQREVRAMQPATKQADEFDDLFHPPGFIPIIEDDGSLALNPIVRADDSWCVPGGWIPAGVTYRPWVGAAMRACDLAYDQKMDAEQAAYMRDKLINHRNKTQDAE